MEKGMIREREWSLGYIIDHWIRFIAIAVLVFTGAYIHWPFLSGGADSFLMAWMRFFHFVAAYALVLGLIVRVYMAFRSTFDSDWRDFSIVQNLKRVPEMIGYYLFLKKSHSEFRKYNPLQALSYLFVGVVILFAALTGAAASSMRGLLRDLLSEMVDERRGGGVSADASCLAVGKPGRPCKAVTG